MIDIYYSTNPQNLQNGFLWQIEMPNGAVNYLYGTFHLHYDALLMGSPELNYVFNKSSKFLFEFELNGGETITLIKKQIEYLLNLKVPSTVDEKFSDFFANTPELHQKICSEVYGIVKTSYMICKDLNFPTFDIIKSLNPIILYRIFQSEAANGITLFTPFILDDVLFYNALRKVKDDDDPDALVNSVESFLDIADIELSVAENISKEELYKYYNESFADLFPENKSIRSRVLNAVAPWPVVTNNIIKANKRDLYKSGTFLRQWIKQRNDQMWQKVAPHFEKGGCFFATGDAHCIGSEGFVEFFQQQDCKVKRIYETKNINNLYYEKYSLIFGSGSLLAGLTILPFQLPLSLIAATAAYLASRAYKLWGSYETLNTHAPRGMESLWYKRSQELYQPLESDAEMPVICRHMTTQFMQQRENIPANFIDVDSLDEGEDKLKTNLLQFTMPAPAA